MSWGSIERDALPAETEMPAPAITTILFFLRNADSSFPNRASSP